MIEVRGQGKLLRSNAAAPPAKTGTQNRTNSAQDVVAVINRHDGKPADMTKPVQIFILLGSGSMIGTGSVAGGEGSLENAVKIKKKYTYLISDAGTWVQRNDTRFVRFMSDTGPLNNEWLTIKPGSIGPEHGIGHVLGNFIDAPVMILKACNGNRSLGWDLLPPGKASDTSWMVKSTLATKTRRTLGPRGLNHSRSIGTLGSNNDFDVADVKKVQLADIGKYYPNAAKFEIAGFFFWEVKRMLRTPGIQSSTRKSSPAHIATA